MSMFADVTTYLLTNMLFTGLLLFPLALITIIKAVSSIMKFMMVHSGFIECSMIRQNNTIDTVMRSPKGRKIIYKGRKFPFSDNQDYILRQGTLPKTFYDLVTGMQLPLKNLNRDVLDSEITDTAVKTSYDLGYKDGLDRIKKDETLQVLMLIGIALIFLGVVYIGFTLSGMNKIIPGIKDVVDAIHNIVKNAQITPPVVG